MLSWWASICWNPQLVTILEDTTAVLLIMQDLIEVKHLKRLDTLKHEKTWVCLQPYLMTWWIIAQYLLPHDEDICIYQGLKWKQPKRESLLKLYDNIGITHYDSIIMYPSAFSVIWIAYVSYFPPWRPWQKRSQKAVCKAWQHPKMRMQNKYKFVHFLCQTTAFSHAWTSIS